MKKIKTMLRLLIKVIITPIILLTSFIVISVFSFLQFYEWLADKDDWISRGIVAEWSDFLKRWFTEL